MLGRLNGRRVDGLDINSLMIVRGSRVTCLSRLPLAQSRISLAGLTAAAVRRRWRLHFDGALSMYPREMLCLIVRSASVASADVPHSSASLPSTTRPQILLLHPVIDTDRHRSGAMTPKT